MKVRFKLKDVAKNWRTLRKTLAVDFGDLSVGVLDDAPTRTGGDLSNVELAVIHEFGAPGAGIPERSFIRSSVDANREKYFATVRRYAAQIYDGKISVESVQGLLGERMVADIKAQIVKGIDPPNSPETAARKAAKSYAGAAPGEPVPLIDTGQLVSSIAYRVEGGK